MLAATANVTRRALCRQAPAFSNILNKLMLLAVVAFGFAASAQGMAKPADGYFPNQRAQLTQLVKETTKAPKARKGRGYALAATR
jgi:hypothetical protein